MRLLILCLVHPDADFECMGVMMDHTQDVKNVAWHPTEEILASASYDDTVKLYIDDPSEDWFCFQTLLGHTSTVWSVSFSPNGNYLASASDDCTVRIWKRVSQHEWEPVTVLEGHDRSVYSVSWGAGKADVEGGLGWLASTGSDGKVNIWELKVSLIPAVKTSRASSNISITKEPSDSSPKTPPEHKLIAKITSAHDVSDVNTVAWCPRKGCEDMLATAGDDSIVRVWKVVKA